MKLQIEGPDGEWQDITDYVNKLPETRTGREPDDRPKHFNCSCSISFDINGVDAARLKILLNYPMVTEWLSYN